jgi:hypothetical protein
MILGALVVAGVAVSGALVVGATRSDAAPASVVTVYKSATCGCCKEWVKHLEANGFAVRSVDVDNLQEMKAASGIPGPLASCHTALVDGYVVEGHVPADLVKKMLRERPAIAGLAVPGMPSGSPGMEGPRKDRYNVMAFEGGSSHVYATR